MTESEAIRILDPETTREALFGTSREEGIKLAEEACKVAVKAMEKQEAKETVHHDNCGNPTLYTTRCPKCFEIVEKSYLGNVSWCRHCGQKISWE